MIVCPIKDYDKLWVCLHGLESRSERRFKTWFGLFLIWKPDFSPCKQKLFQIRLLERVLKREKKGVLDRDPPRKPDSSPCKRKAVSERESCVCILKMRAEAMHKRMGQSARADCVVTITRSAQFLIVIGKAFVAHVNARSSNHDPNHVPKRLSERDSSPCKHTL